MTGAIIDQDQLARRLWRVATKMLLGDQASCPDWQIDQERHDMAKQMAVYLIMRHLPFRPSGRDIADVAGYSKARTLSEVAGLLDSSKDDHPDCKAVIDRWSLVRYRAFIRRWDELPPDVVSRAHAAWRGNE